MGRKSVELRPKKRTIVRWDDNLDELLLLSIQSVCNSQSVKIPWAEVARTMGHNTTEGAIVQHLSKLRLRRVQAKKEVPPPLKRGSGGAYTKASETASDPKEASQVNGCGSSDEEWVENKTSSRRRTAPRRKKPRVRYTEIPESEHEETDGSVWELVASGAKFLELPNDKQQEPLNSPAPATSSKIVSYKCPKSFLAGLGRNMSKDNVFEAAPTERPILEPKPALTPDPIPKSESVPKVEPAVKSEPITPNRGAHEAFPNEIFVNPTNILTRYNTPFDHDGAVHAGFAAHTTVQSSMEVGTMYIPTGNPVTDLSPIGEEFPDPFVFNDPLPALQEFQMDQNFLPDNAFQDMLGEYFIHPGASGWYGGQPE